MGSSYGSKRSVSQKGSGIGKVGMAQPRSGGHTQGTKDPWPSYSQEAGEGKGKGKGGPGGPGSKRR